MASSELKINLLQGLIKGNGERERETNGNREKSNKSNPIFKTSLGPNTIRGLARTI